MLVMCVVPSLLSDRILCVRVFGIECVADGDLCGCKLHRHKDQSRWCHSQIHLVFPGNRSINTAIVQTVRGGCFGRIPCAFSCPVTVLNFVSYPVLCSVMSCRRVMCSVLSCVRVCFSKGSLRVVRSGRCPVRSNVPCDRLCRFKILVVFGITPGALLRVVRCPFLVLYIVFSPCGLCGVPP